MVFQEPEPRLQDVSGRVICTKDAIEARLAADSRYALLLGRTALLFKTPDARVLRWPRVRRESTQL